MLPKDKLDFLKIGAGNALMLLCLVKDLSGLAFAVGLKPRGRHWLLPWPSDLDIGAKTAHLHWLVTLEDSHSTEVIFR